MHAWRWPVRTDGESDLPGRRRPRQPEMERPCACGCAAGLPHELPTGDDDLVRGDGDRRIDGAAARWQVDAWKPRPRTPNLLRRMIRSG
jgi:hypothetical protein